MSTAAPEATTSAPSTAGPASARPRSAARPPAARRDAPDLSPVIHPLAVLHALRRRWKSAVFLAIPAAALAAATVWTVVPATYTALAVLGIEAVEPKVVFETADAKPDFATYRQRQVGHITSQFVLTSAMRKPGVGDSATLREQPYAVDWLENHLEVGTHRSPEFLKIALTGTRPAELATIVNAVKDAYLEEVVHAERNARLTKLANLERIFEETDEKVRLKQSRVEKLARQLGSGDSKALSIRQQMSLEYYGQLQREYSRVRFELMREQIDPGSTSPTSGAGFDAARPLFETEAADQSGSAASTSSTAMSSSTQDPEVATLSRRIAQLRDLIARFEKQVVDQNHPALAEHRRQLNTLEKQLAEREESAEDADSSATAPRHPGLSTRSRAAAKNKLSRREVLQRQETALRDEVEKYSTLVDTIGTSSFELESMQTELSQITKIADRVYQELAALRIELQSPARVKLLQAADVPQKQDKGKKIKLAGLAGVGTLGLILAASTLLDIRQRRVSSPAEIAGTLHLPVLGSLPPHPHDHNVAAEGLWNASVEESADSVRTMLLRGEDPTQRKVFLVGSATSGEGKSSLAAALGRSFARTGRRTLLIDFDLRRPAVHTMLGLPLENGSSEALLRESDPLTLVQDTRLPGLFALTAGSCSEAARQALARGEGTRVIQALKKEFDCILLDTPPLLLLADAAVIGREADAAVLAVRRDESRLPFVAAARDRLAALSVPIAGTVLLGYRSTLQQSAYDYHRRDHQPTASVAT